MFVDWKKKILCRKVGTTIRTSVREIDGISKVQKATWRQTRVDRYGKNILHSYKIDYRLQSYRDKHITITTTKQKFC